MTEHESCFWVSLELVKLTVFPSSEINADRVEQDFEIAHPTQTTTKFF
ncbi:hypothetical protein [Sporisorium scitamineum]|uniref:Uncharacterized protein n=1 Tax=Sporisorium scitamineum TaxID=49012 RepID=A0A0F7S045_9BASI|nr:hypothetical protein [Sporisorium scitamineum]